MEAGDFRGPAIVYEICLQFRFYCKKRVVIIKLNPLRQILTDLPQHLSVVARRLRWALVAILCKIGATLGVLLLAIEVRKVVVADLVVGVRHRTKRQHPR